MSECLSSPWIRDYFLGVAETYGAKLFNIPVSTARKKVQLTDFLTYQENAYVWAWISDKDYRVSVRISKDAVDQYRSNHSRDIIDSRFSVVFVSSYRPMFSPRPLGPNTTGNTPVSHISLEIGHVKRLSVGSHLFGSPHDLESDKHMKEWVLGLRQDGGGGNVLKLRKEQELAQNKKAPVSPPSSPPFSLYAPVSPRPTSKATENVAKPKSEQPKDFKRAYAKRWRIIEANPWKLATKPAAEEQAECSSYVEQHLDTTTQLESRDHTPALPRRTPSPTSRSQRQGTPTDWSPSIRGSPGEPPIVTSERDRQRGEPEVTLSPLRLPSDVADVEVHATVDADTPQPPTPAQPIKCIAPPRSSPPRSSPAVFACSSPSQQLPRSSPPPPSSSLPLPSSSLAIPMNIRKNIQRKVPHPGLPAHQLEPTKQGPARILVPNSDTSGMGSSQPHSQSQQYGPRSPPSSPVKDSNIPGSFTPLDTPVVRIENEGQKNTSIAHVPRHDSEAWKEPSFVARYKGKEKARADKEASTSSVPMGKKRRLSAQPESSVLKRVKVDAEEVPNQTTNGEAPANGTICSNDRPSASPSEATDTTALSTVRLARPRLANLVIDFASIDLGKRVLVPVVDMDRDMKSTLLRTGRIRTLGKEVEEEGRVYIMR